MNGMSILVAGLINIETTLRVERFPIDYFPVRYPFFGVNSSVSGVGYNVAKALTHLGHKVELLTLLGDDASGALVRAALANEGIDGQRALKLLPATPQSVILYDGEGRRQINVDLKNIQETAYPLDQAEAVLAACSLAVLCNINFARPLIARAKAAGKRIATDVHAISSLSDDYNRDFMAGADIVFMSHEHLPVMPEEWARMVLHQYGPQIVVIGLGAQGALLAVRDDNRIERIPAVVTRPIVNTIGAGDALFSAFVHVYDQTGDPYRAIRHAAAFASWKIGVAGAADGFLSADELEALVTGLE
jgi:acarbose 7IV-phosphotransferase